MLAADVSPMVLWVLGSLLLWVALPLLLFLFVRRCFQAYERRTQVLAQALAQALARDARTAPLDARRGDDPSRTP